MKFTKLTRNVSALSAVLIVALFLTAAASAAAAGYTLFGNASLVSPGNASPTAARLTSLCPEGYPACLQSGGTFTYSGVDFTIPAGMTVNDLVNLSTDTKYIVGGCGGGSPRFQVNVTNGTTTGNIQVNLGPPPSYNTCALGVWTNSGNLVTPASLVDTSQLPAGNFYDPYAAAQAKYGTFQITGIQIVADGGWAVLGNNQTVDVDNVTINNQTTTFEKPVATNKDQCKDGGWMSVVRGDGSGFKNQGDCIQYVNTGK